MRCVDRGKEFQRCTPIDRYLNYPPGRWDYHKLPVVVTNAVTDADEKYPCPYLGHDTPCRPSVNLLSVFAVAKK
jgi:hypothetical protein